MDFSYFDNQEDTEDWFDVADQDYPDDRGSELKVLSKKDYNLNSPLTPDVIDLAVTYVNTEGKDLIIRSENPILEPLERLGAETRGGRVKGKVDFHRWVGEKIYQGRNNDKTFFRFFRDQTSNCGTIGRTITAFLFLIIGKSGDFESKVTKEVLFQGSYGYIWKYLEWFWFFHKVVLMMNSESGSGRSEIRAADPDTFVEVIEYESGFKATGSSPLGKFSVVDGFLLFSDENRILDRNMTLMIKDTLIARASSLLTMLDRCDGSFDRKDVSKMNDFYVEGDKLTCQLERGGFSAIKLIEPTVLQRIHELASSFRPLIPEFSDFKSHNQASLTQLTVTHQVDHSPFFDFISKETKLNLLLSYFGSFRHWGHPFIDYLEGLRKLHDQVTVDKGSMIDLDYAQELASDLAKTVILKVVREKMWWPVDVTLISPDNPLYTHVSEGTLPTGNSIRQYGHRWHLLPLLQCFEVPDTIDMSILYGDKAHSVERPDVLEAVRQNRPRIPTRRVLNTLLDTKQTNIKEFLQDINDHGLSSDSLVIGLKGKEREIKEAGRFFALLSWKLREYFVITEYLIKTFYVPLFSGLTMADDLISVTKKMLNSSSGQGTNSYSQIGIANHVDYEKWNNHQRKEANDPVFRVMGQFLGFPNLITRTHEFFEKSLIYYIDRPDLMAVSGGGLVNKTTSTVCWNGQAGGLEGLRQKGWSIVNYLVIAKETEDRNTKVDTIAQGDNQVIRTLYLADYKENKETTMYRLHQLVQNNNDIMRAIRTGTSKLGLIINETETLVSADMLVYGKVIVFRGNILGLETKRFSRVTCITNDQLPSLANVLSTVSTNALTVAQQSGSIVQPILSYCFFGLFCSAISRFYNPLLEKRLGGRKDFSSASWNKMLLRTLFLDPGLGGTSGTSLSRFLVRQYPDPITESLSFWKGVYNNTDDPVLRSLCLEAGNPRLAIYDFHDLSKLVENPSSLNLPKVSNAASIIKEQVKLGLIKKVEQFKHGALQSAIRSINESEESILAFFHSHKPLFPRFLSEFRAGSFMGITDSFINLFANAKSLRNRFSHTFAAKTGEMVRKGELRNIQIVDEGIQSGPVETMWDCSAKHADYMRNLSWGHKVAGATVPHPMELFGRLTTPSPWCDVCKVGDDGRHLVARIDGDLTIDPSTRGSKSPYLGSVTSESTGMFHHWEKENSAPLLKVSAKLRNVIGWFVKEGSRLASSIYNNLQSLTGIDWFESLLGFSRTGSAMHRYNSSRQSSGGFISVSPAVASYVFVTSDEMRDLNQTNYDFLYQSGLLWAQLAGIERKLWNSDLHGPSVTTLHAHIGCELCLRIIDEEWIESDNVYDPPAVDHVIKTYSVSDLAWTKPSQTFETTEGNWEALSAKEQSFHIGAAQGSVFGVLLTNQAKELDEGSLFPQTLVGRLIELPYLLGLLKGIESSAAYSSLLTRALVESKKGIMSYHGQVINVIRNISSNKSLLNLLNKGKFPQILRSVSHRITPSYPSSDVDLGDLVRTYLIDHHKRRTLDSGDYHGWSKEIWIFSDFRTSKWIGILAINHHLRILLDGTILTKSLVEEIKTCKAGVRYFLDLEGHDAQRRLEDLMRRGLEKYIRPAKWCTSEIRHAAKLMKRPVQSLRSIFEGIKDEAEYDWGTEWWGTIDSVKLNYTNRQTDLPLNLMRPYKTIPLISGLRLGQLATGAHYKIRSIIKSLGWSYTDFICGGDGSGGMTAALLRNDRMNMCIFNSLMDLEQKELKGSKPTPPSSLQSMNSQVRRRCVNLDTCWSQSDDLSDWSTWNHFEHLIKKYDMSVDLIVLDMECKSLTMSRKIFKNVVRFCPKIFKMGGKLIMKLYGSQLNNEPDGPLRMIGSMFKETRLVSTEVTSSHSDELYLVCKDLTTKGSPTHLGSDTGDLISLVTKSYRTVKEEFDRARGLQVDQMLKGIPKVFVTSGYDDLLYCLYGVRVNNDVAFRWANTFGHSFSRGNGGIYALALAGMVSNQKVSITNLYPTPSGMPSDQEIHRLMGFLFGIQLYYALRTNNVGQYRRMVQYYNEAFYWNQSSVTRDRGIGVSWNISLERLPTGRHKIIPEVGARALTGMVIRALSKLHPGDFPPVTNDHVKEINKVLGSDNQHLTWNRLLSRSGTYCCLWRNVSEIGRPGGDPSIHPEVDSRDPMDSHFSMSFST